MDTAAELKVVVSSAALGLELEGESSGAIAAELIELMDVGGVGSCATPVRRGEEM